MNNITTWVVIGLVILAGGFGLYKVMNAPQDTAMQEQMTGEMNTNTDTATGDMSTAGGASSYTMADVALHANAESCWSVVRGEVYDLTNWIGKHPGGERAILGLCGKDGTSAFEGQHGGSNRPESTLASFKLGVLAQ